MSLTYWGAIGLPYKEKYYKVTTIPGVGCYGLDFPRYFCCSEKILMGLEKMKDISGAFFKSLYSVIPDHDGLKALKFFLDKRPNKELSRSD